VPNYIKERKFINKCTPNNTAVRNLVHKLWKLEGTAVPIISPAHGAEHGAGKCKFNEEWGGGEEIGPKKTVFTYSHGRYPNAVTQNTQVSPLKYNEPITKDDQFYLDILTFRSPGSVRKFRLPGSIDPLMVTENLCIAVSHGVGKTAFCLTHSRT
jgi:hypothetical protein